MASDKVTNKDQPIPTNTGNKCLIFHDWSNWSDIVHKWITHRGFWIGDKDIQERWCQRCNKYSYRVVGRK